MVCGGCHLMKHVADRNVSESDNVTTPKADLFGFLAGCRVIDRAMSAACAGDTLTADMISKNRHWIFFLLEAFR